MINITTKSSTLRKAIAQAILRVSRPETIDAVINKTVPKGDVLEMAKTAGLFAAKRTSDIIPDCHPLPIEYTGIRYEAGKMEIRVYVEIHTIYKTGVEVEAMHAASVVALTMYDMLKPIDKGISIEQIKLVEKRGGKSDLSKDQSQHLRAAVIVCSDSVASGKKEDSAGRQVVDQLQVLGVELCDYQIIGSAKADIQKAVKEKCTASNHLVICVGGTGLASNDTTPEALHEILEKEVPGIEEAMRNYGQQRTPYAMLSRSSAGLIGESLVLALPGSTRGAIESMNAIFPAVFHIFRVMLGSRH